MYTEFKAKWKVLAIYFQFIYRQCVDGFGQRKYTREGCWTRSQNQTFSLEHCHIKLFPEKFDLEIRMRQIYASERKTSNFKPSLAEQYSAKFNPFPPAL